MRVDLCNICGRNKYNLNHNLEDQKYCDWKTNKMIRESLPAFIESKKGTRVTETTPTPAVKSQGREIVDAWDMKHFGRVPVETSAFQRRVREDLIVMFDKKLTEALELVDELCDTMASIRSECTTKTPDRWWIIDETTNAIFRAKQKRDSLK